MVRNITVSIWSILFGVASWVVPLATADPMTGQYTYVRSQSGITRCVVHLDGVVCEAGQTPQQSHTGFLQAPMVEGTTFHWDDAEVTATGVFQWRDANIGGSHPQDDIVLNYGQVYHFNGWTILPTRDGTRFSNDGTGHGMFVSIENVYAF